MHEGEVETDAGLVRRLLASQFPEWAELPVERVPSSGTVNALYRLGDDLVVRLPRMDWGIGAVARELQWLPLLAPRLPIAIPEPLALGRPADGYPHEWGVYRWLEGETPRPGALGDAHSLARELAAFVRALHGVDAEGDPPTGRGVPLAEFDESVRDALGALEGVIDTEAARDAWDESLATPPAAATVWTHGDLMPANLLMRDGTLTAVIDWGGMGLGDPACDLAVGWNLFDAGARTTLRSELGVDDDTWTRGRGWALWTGLLALPYYKDTNPELAENARFRVGEVLADATGGTARRA
jgi:aminoglycoside phosphotransferase (APT) family kinase protein